MRKIYVQKGMSNLVAAMLIVIISSGAAAASYYWSKQHMQDAEKRINEKRILIKDYEQDIDKMRNDSIVQKQKLAEQKQAFNELKESTDSHSNLAHVKKCDMFTLGSGGRAMSCAACVSAGSDPIMRAAFSEHRERASV